MTTIKDIAKKADVSIATVSHVINKTRYVSPNLQEKVERVIAQTGYSKKIDNIGRNFNLGKKSVFAFVVPNIHSTMYAKLGMALMEYLMAEGFFLSVYTYKDNADLEKLILTGLMADKKTAGIFLAPAGSKWKIYSKVVRSGIPLVCLERTVTDIDVESVLSENVEAMYLGTKHLIQSGHERIGILMEINKISTGDERLEGYKKALEQFSIAFDEKLVNKIDLYNKSRPNIFEKAKWKIPPTAFIATGNTLTLELLKDIEAYGLECPKDVSVVGFGDDDWSDIINPSLTTLTQDPEKMAQGAFLMMMNKIKGKPVDQLITRIPVGITVQMSTRVINRGPFGEKAVMPEELALTPAEVERLKKENYKVAISFHYSGTEWTRLHEMAIRDTLGKYGVRVIAVMNANFDPALQVTQLDAIRLQKPDAIISVPADENITAGKFKDISKVTKLILIGNVPQGFSVNDYYSCVSMNERENGQNAGKILGEHFRGEKEVPIGLLCHGLPFHMTKQRDSAAEQVILENYPNLKIVDKRNFYRIPNAYEMCRSLIKEHPEVRGLYVSWERPALEAIHALEKMGRTDVAIVTVDLDQEITEYMAKGKMVIGLTVQRPYEQGEAAAMAAVYALLGKQQYKFIGVQPMVVLPNQLSRAWRSVIRTPLPDFLVRKGQMNLRRI